MSADPQRVFPPPPTPAFIVAGCGLALVVGLTVAFQHVEPQYRVWNLSAVGAVALFAAARLGLVHGFLFAAAAVIFKDLAYYLLTNWWEPYPLAWLYFAGYALAGWYFLRRPAAPVRIIGTALGVSLSFFVVSNFVAWLEQARPYGYSLEGLLNCYAAGIPFYRGTLLGDVLFTAALFGANAVLVWTFAPTAAAEEVRATEEHW